MIPKGADKLTYVRKAKSAIWGSKSRSYESTTTLSGHIIEHIMDCLDELEEKLKQEKEDVAKRKRFREMKEESKLCDSCGRRFLNVGSICSTCRNL